MVFDEADEVDIKKIDVGVEVGFALDSDGVFWIWGRPQKERNKYRRMGEPPKEEPIMYELLTDEFKPNIANKVKYF